MATTAGNSNRPRLGVPITIRSAAATLSSSNGKPVSKVTNQTTSSIHADREFARMIGPLFHPHVLFKVVVGRVVALKLPRDPVGISTVAEALFEKYHH